MTGKEPVFFWFTTAELLDYFQITRKTLYTKKQLLLQGIHYKKKYPKKTNSELLWRLDLLEEILGSPVPPFQKQVLENALQGKITCNF